MYKLRENIFDPSNPVSSYHANRRQVFEKWLDRATFKVCLE